MDMEHSKQEPMMEKLNRIIEMYCWQQDLLLRVESMLSEHIDSENFIMFAKEDYEEKELVETLPKIELMMLKMSNSINIFRKMLGNIFEIPGYSHVPEHLETASLKALLLDNNFRLQDVQKRLEKIEKEISYYTHNDVHENMYDDY